MSMNLAQCRTMVETDFRNFDGLSAVGYIVLETETGNTTNAVAIAHALATRDLDEQESSLGTVYPGRRTVIWHMLKSALDSFGITPHPRDRIVDQDGNVWVTQRVQLQSWDARYRFNCVELLEEGIEE